MSETLIVTKERTLVSAVAPSPGGEIALIIPAYMGRTDKVYTVDSTDKFIDYFGDYSDNPYNICKYLLKRGNILKVVRTGLDPQYEVANPQPTSETFSSRTYYVFSSGSFVVASTFDSDVAAADGYYLAVVPAPASTYFTYGNTAQDPFSGGIKITARADGEVYNSYGVRITNQGGVGPDNLFSLAIYKIRGTSYTLVENYSLVSLNPNSVYFVGSIDSNLVKITVWQTIDNVTQEGYDGVSTLFSVSEPTGSSIPSSLNAPKSLQGGVGKGVGISNEVYIEAAKLLKNRDEDFTSLLIPDKNINDSYTIVSEEPTGSGLITREDFIFLPELGDYSTEAGAVTAITGIDSSYIAAYFPKGQCSGLSGTTDPSIGLADLIAQLSRKHLWFKAPAGLVNGILSDWYDLNVRMTDAEIANAQNNRLNPVVVKSGVGCVVWDQQTLAKSITDIKDLATRLLVNYLKRSIYNLSQKYVFADHIPFTWNQWVMEVEPLVRDIANVNGVRAYKVRCDESTMSEKDIEDGVMRGEVVIWPNTQIRQIYITFTVDKSGVSFE